MAITTSLRAVLEQALITFEVTPDVITDEVTFTGLGLDSLAVVELTDALAASLGRPLADDTLYPAMTVEQAMAALEQGGTP